MITKDEILKHWQIQEHLLQSYRSLFLISQSVIISFAALITANNKVDASAIIIYCLLMILGIVLLNYWRQIARARALDVSYLQALLYHHAAFENKENLMLEFKAWQKFDIAGKKKFIEAHSIGLSRTRLVMENRVPLLFFAVWIVLMAINLYRLTHIDI